jgi:biopolymer transport protein ExbB
MHIMDLIQTGGPIAWVIVLCGLVSIVLFFWRWFHLHRARISVDDFLKGIFNILRRNNTAEAVAICEETPGPVSYLVKTAILHRESGRERLRDVLDEAGRSEIARMERWLVGISTIGQTAPLLGLLGTVVAMVQALLVMQQQAPLVQSGDIIGWLRQALITTGFGLSVAIPCHIGYNFLASRVEKNVVDMERAASEILAFLTGE